MLVSNRIIEVHSYGQGIKLSNFRNTWESDHNVSTLVTAIQIYRKYNQTLWRLYDTDITQNDNTKHINDTVMTPHEECRRYTRAV